MPRCADERKRSHARKLDGAVGRMRRLQEQAWADHDEDDQRERQALSLGSTGQQPSDGKADGKDARQSSGPSVSIRFQSQRSQYLRIILDAEKEIARLEGLYDGLLDVDGAVGFVVIRRDQNDQGGLLPSSATHRAILPPSENPADGAS